MYAKVVVDVPSSNTDELFTYHIPSGLEECIYIGSRVFVEFGFRNILGYVIELTEDANFEGNLKDILEVVDFEQGLNNEQISLAKKISEDTKSFLTTSLGLMYPSFMQSKIRKYINVLNYESMDAELALLFSLKKKVLITKEILEKYHKIKKEIDKGNIEITSNVYTYGKNKMIKYYHVINSNFNYLSEKRQAVLVYLNNVKEATLDEIKDNVGCSDFIINKLVKDKFISFEERKPQLEINEEKYSKRIIYNPNTEEIREKFRRLDGKPFVLYSNDESFKLDFYLDLAVQTINANKQVLIVTPTLLTNSLVYNFFKRNMKGYRLFNFTSNMANNEYYYNYNNVKEQNVDIVICTKVGIFVPLENIGLIIMVDEDNLNYINEQNPKFNTLEILKERSLYHNAKLLLTSSALSIDSYYQYFNAKYFLLSYIIDNEKKVQLINMREELSDLLLSNNLKNKLKEKLTEKQVSMLILNNLGYNTLIMCEECGHIIKCPKCKVSLSYHKEKDIYRCSMCNMQTDKITCDNCGSVSFKRLGFGLEQLKERLEQLYPQAKILQIDSETMNEKEDYDDFLVALEEKEVDIIIGTNNLINGVNSNIKLIGLINADNLLNMNDYRSSEIVFNTISKINSYSNCDVIIQGYHLEHYAIQAAIENNYEFYYNNEITTRKNYNYPPLIEVNKLVIIGDYKDIYYYANYFKKVYSRISNENCLGPVYLPKVKGVQLLIKHQDFKKVSNLIDEVNKKFSDRKIIVNFERYPKAFS